ncbi:MAG: hypothetical protein JJU40_02845 [Rhodobacteraceae bacterium]|nr:hypothetical protein [Paracoccaceae bacterium]
MNADEAPVLWMRISYFPGVPLAVSDMDRAIDAVLLAVQEVGAEDPAFAIEISSAVGGAAEMPFPVIGFHELTDGAPVAAE